MMKLFPLIKLNRLVIFTFEGKIAYNENFHSGVNIVRGNNSSGKSTIINFIYYVLGGDLRKWTKAAEECAVVYAEVEVNSAKITLKRQVATDKTMQPMSIFWGDYETAKKSAQESWEVYGYKSLKERKSFSNALFVALGFPELKGDVDNNITMHQILRLMYSDQRSLTQDLLMTETFDSSITRQTIGDLLFGIYDDILYSEKLMLREDEKEYEIDNQQIKGIKQIYEAAGNQTNPDEIKQSIEEKKEQLNKIDQEIILQENVDSETNNIIDSFQSEEYQKELFELRSRLSHTQENIEKLEYELSDSEKFIKSLERRLEALNEALLTRGALSQVSFMYCPHCLSPIEDHNIEEGDCYLCKQKLPEDYLKSQIKRMQQEIDNQIRESKKMLKIRNSDLLEERGKIPALQLRIRNIQEDIQKNIRIVRTKYNVEKEKLYVQKGELKASINFLINQLVALEEIVRLEVRLQQLHDDISHLRQSIYSKEELQKGRIVEVRRFVDAMTHQILSSDLGRQDDFKKQLKIEFDFKSNTFSYGETNNFSESSVVFLKNSILFAIFFASLEFSFFRYPRFFLCDNIEDKGMEEERSQSFQRKIVELSNNMNVEHQIIFSTSKIAPELNNTNYCIGKYYSAENHSLENIKV